MNLGPHTDEGIAGGVATIVNTLRQQLPNTRILLLGILPRTGAGNFDRITAINTIIGGLHDGQYVHYLDMFNAFSSDVWGGRDTEMMYSIYPNALLLNVFFTVVPPALFFDGLHLTTLGYDLWAHTMNPLFNQLLQ